MFRILYFAPHEPWPPNTGARLRDYYLARELARRASVTFAGVRGPAGPEPEPPPDGSGFEKIVMLTKDASYTPGKLLRGLFGPEPVTVLNFLSARMRAEIEALAARERFDAVQLEGIQLVKYVPLLRRMGTCPAVLSDWHNIESELMRRYGERAGGPKGVFARRTARLLENAEAELLEGCDGCAVVSERERAVVMGQTNRPVRVIPNGVDAGRYAEHEMAACRRPDWPDGTILFVGSMDYHANVDAVQWFSAEMWPEISNRCSLPFVVAGRNPAPEVRALAAERLVVTGALDDTRPMYAAARVMVAPLRVGSGTRLKILEAMAAGVPVVSTTLGAEGLDAVDGRHLLIADTPGDFVQAVTRILSGNTLAAALAANARSFVAARYDWSIIGSRLYDFHAELIDAARRAAMATARDTYA